MYSWDDEAFSVNTFTSDVRARTSGKGVSKVIVSRLSFFLQCPKVFIKTSCLYQFLNIAYFYFFLRLSYITLSRIVRKRDYCLCENKGADQLCSNCEADQRLCFRYWDSTIPLLLKSEISSF